MCSCGWSDFWCSGLLEALLLCKFKLKTISYAASPMQFWLLMFQTKVSLDLCYLFCKGSDYICLLPPLTPFNVLKFLITGEITRHEAQNRIFSKKLCSSFRWIHIWMYGWCIFLPLSGFLSKDKLTHMIFFSFFFFTFLLQQLREGFLVELEFSGFPCMHLF